MRPFGYTILSLVAVIACHGPALEGASHKQADVTEGAIPEAQFVDSMGVNVHLNFTDGAYARLDRVRDDMRYLGLVHVRTHDGGDTVPLSDYARLASEGLRFNLIATADQMDRNVDFAARLMAQVPGSVVSIEGFNEINNWPVSYRGLHKDEAGRAAQRDLYAKVKAHAGLAHLPVLYFTGGDAVSDLSGMADWANVHAYSNNAQQPGPALREAFAKFTGSAARAPRANTEFGNFTLPEGWPEGKPYWANYTQLGIDEVAQAKLVLTAYFEGAESGIGRSYVYELLDEKRDPKGTEPEFHFGLFTFEHRPKAAAKALHSLTSFLARTRSDKVEGPIGARLKTADGSIGILPLQREDGSLIVALWSRSPFWRWDRNYAGPAQTPMKQVELVSWFDNGKIKAVAFDPLEDATAKLKVRGGHNIAVAVPNYPILVYLQKR